MSRPSTGQLYPPPQPDLEGGGGGGGGTPYATFVQNDPQSQWVVPWPSAAANVTVVDSAGEQIEPGSLIYNASSHTITIPFSAPTSGRAYIS